MTWSLDGDWNKNSALSEQKDLLGAVSVFVADDAVPKSEVLKETVEGEVIVDFLAMDADGKNEASPRNVVIEEVLVLAVGAPQNDGLEAPCEHSAVEFEVSYVSTLVDHRQGRNV